MQKQSITRAYVQHWGKDEEGDVCLTLVGKNERHYWEPTPKIFITFFSLSLFKIVFLFLLEEEENSTGHESCEGLYYLELSIYIINNCTHVIKNTDSHPFIICIQQTL